MSSSFRMAAAVAAVVALAVGCGGAQDSPAETVETLSRHIEQGEFDKACDLLLPEIREQYARVGKSCQGEFADDYDQEKRAALADVDVDEDNVDVNGDTATVPEAAITFGGRPSDDGGVELVRQDGKWFVSGNSDSAGSGD